MKLYTILNRPGLYDSSLTEDAVPVGSVQSFSIRLDDLLVGSVYAQTGIADLGDEQYVCSFCKGKLKRFGVTLSSTAANYAKAGRMALSFIWFSEAEALESVEDLKHRQVPVLPDFRGLLQTPGTLIAPVTRSLTRWWTPPPNSWVRDYVRIGQSRGKGSGASWGLPVGRLIVGYQDIISSEEKESYSALEAALNLDIHAVVDLAEMGSRLLSKQLDTEYNADQVGVYSSGALTEVSASQIVKSEGCLSILPEVRAVEEAMVQDGQHSQMHFNFATSK